MDLGAVNTGLSSLFGPNFTIIIGIFVTLAVMGIATLYDKHRSAGKIPDKAEGSKSSIDLSQKIQDLRSVYKNKFSEYSKKISALIPKNTKHNNPENNEIKPLKPETGIQKVLGTLKNKISALPSTLRGKKNQPGSKEPALEPDKEEDISKFVENAKIISIDIDGTADLNKDGKDFGTNVPAQMPTASSSTNNDAAVLNTDQAIEKSEYETGLGAIAGQSAEKDLLPVPGAEKVVLVDKSDSLLDSLKKDIVIKKEKKIDFMSDMQGENLDLKLMKTDLQEVFNKLKTFKQIHMTVDSKNL